MRPSRSSPRVSKEFPKPIAMMASWSSAITWCLWTSKPMGSWCSIWATKSMELMRLMLAPPPQRRLDHAEGPFAPFKRSTLRKEMMLSSMESKLDLSLILTFSINHCIFTPCNALHKFLQDSQETRRYACQLRVYTILFGELCHKMEMDLLLSELQFNPTLN